MTSPIISGMHNGQLNPKQLDAMIAVVPRHVEFLGRLNGRMRERGFLADDHLLRLTLAPDSAERALHGELLSPRVAIKERSHSPPAALRNGKNGLMSTGPKTGFTVCCAIGAGSRRQT